MATDDVAAPEGLLATLAAPDWSVALRGVTATELWLRAATPGDPQIENVVRRLSALGEHSKWEIRRAVANVAASVGHPGFEGALAKLVTDDNVRVREAAERAATRRRDWQNASTLGKQHEDRVNSTLDDIEVRFGTRGRDAVRRASEQIADTFARELYHEVIKLVSPLTSSADRLRARLDDPAVTRTELASDAARIEQRVAQLRAVLDAMRAYTAQPALPFAVIPLKELAEEVAAIVRDAVPSRAHRIVVEVRIDDDLRAEVCRTRLIQALTNVVINALESYGPDRSPRPVILAARATNGAIEIQVDDAGCGMSTENIADARRLFATNKPGGTGFGLPLAVKIIESEHAGRLSLESIKDMGTVVRMVIPIHQRERT